MTDENRSSFLDRALGWLRAGYPTGVPKRDYIALLGVLRVKLSEDEIRKIAKELADQSQKYDEPITSEDIEKMIDQKMLQEATPADVARVSAHLAAGGWPLADPPTS
jgi:hypothetical protein